MSRHMRTFMIVCIVFFLLLTFGMIAAGMAMNKEGHDEEPVRSVPKKGHTAPVSYPYSQFDKRGQALYDALYKGILNQEDEIRLPDTYNRLEYEKVYLTVSMQEPELISLDKAYETSDLMQSAKIHYAIKKDKADSMRDEMERVADEIIKKTKNAASDMEKMLIIHDEIAMGCEYEEQWDIPDSAYTALVRGRAQCEGYAKAFAYVCRRAGLDVMLVTGKSGRGENHVWNKANMDGAYYNIDVTWDDVSGYVTHSCFAIADALFGDHLPDYRGFTPPASGMDVTETYYYQRNLMVRNYSEFPEQIRQWARTAGGSMIEFQCADTVTFEEVCYALQMDPTLCTPENCGTSLDGRRLIPDEMRQVVVIL